MTQVFAGTWMYRLSNMLTYILHTINLLLSHINYHFHIVNFKFKLSNYMNIYFFPFILSN